MTLGEQQRLFTQLIGQLIAFTYSTGMELTFGEAYRSKEQQALYKQQGKSQTSNSKHMVRLAVDFNLFINGHYQTQSEAYKPLGEFGRPCIRAACGAVTGRRSRTAIISSSRRSNGAIMGMQDRVKGLSILLYVII